MRAPGRPVHGEPPLARRRAGECTVAEDSATDVAAAVAAGMTVFGHAALMLAHRLRAAGTNRVFDRMADLPGALR